jgi:uncharacterized membrane protein YgcG
MKTFVLTLIFILLAGVTAYASPTYRITDIDVYIDVTPSGAAHVRESVTYRFTSAANGVFKDIDFAGHGAFQQYSVQLQTRGRVTDFDIVSRARVGDSGVFTIETRRNDSARFQVFSPAVHGDAKTFVYTYTLTEGAFLYENTAVFHRMVMGHGWDATVENFRVTLTLPDGTEVARQFSGIPAGHGVELAVQFAPELLHGANARGGVWEGEVFSGIVEPPVRQQSSVGQIILVVVIGAVVFGIIGAVAYVTVLAWPHKTDFNEKYFRNLPADNGPALMSYLVKDRNIKPRDIVATLLHLVQRGVLSVSGDTFTLNNHREILRTHERFLVDWLFVKTENGMECSLADVNAAGENEETALEFFGNFTSWTEKISQEAELMNYYENKYRRSPLAEEEYQKWLAFRRYIKHTISGKILEAPPSAEQMEKFAPYIVSLGLCKKAAKINVPESTQNSDDAFNYNFAMYFLIASSWNSSVKGTYSRGYAQSVSQEFSDSGSSSFGGGSVGGGGSGGGAF